MYVRPLHPSNNFDYYISGEVTIDPSAAIACGVILQASPNSRILIGAGVCIGMGSVLHAHEGTLEVEAGANLGAGVLLVGKGKIGTNACIGSTTTIVNRSIEPLQVVAPGSVIGDESRQIAASRAVAATGVASERATTNRSPEAQSPSTLAPATSDETNAPARAPSPDPETTVEPTESEPDSPQSTPTKVSGQAHLNRMLSTMFPHRQALSRPLQDGKPPSDKT